MKQRPNFLIFVTDQMSSFSLGCNGNSTASTPNIDKLAKNGVNFTRTYCNNTVCMPSRSTMITGLTPRQHGCITNGTKLPENIPTITEALAKNGYRTYAAGKLHFQPISPTNDTGDPAEFSYESLAAWDRGDIKKLPDMYYGFEKTDFVNGHVSFCYGEYVNEINEKYPGLRKMYTPQHAYHHEGSAYRMDIPKGLHYNDWIADRTIQFIADRKEDENYFAFCSFPDPHPPYATSKPYSEMFDPNTVELNSTWKDQTDLIPLLSEKREHHHPFADFDEKFLREATAQTYGMIAHVDDCIGRVIQYLEDNGLKDNTVIVFMSDHGEYLGCHHLVGKADWMYEELLRVSFIWNFPESVKDLCIDTPVSMLDFATTILDFAQISQSELDTRGIYNAPPMGLPGRSLKESILSGNSPVNKPIFIEYDEDWNKDYFSRTRTVIYKQFKLSLYPGHPGTGEGILIDLDKDPNESINLYNDPEYLSIKAMLLEMLLNELALSDRLDTQRICGA